MSLGVAVGNVSASGFGWRVDGEYFGLDRAAADADLTGFGLSGSAGIVFGSESVRPYVLVGLGAYGLQLEGLGDNPYGNTWAVIAGIGVDVRIWHRLYLFGEARYVQHLTDYGSGGSGSTSHGPVQVGAKWSG